MMWFAQNSTEGRTLPRQTGFSETIFLAVNPHAKVLSGTPHDLGNGVTLSRDDRLIYFSLITTEADIWLMNLE